MENTDKKIFNVNELANYLGVRESYVYKMRREGIIPYFRLGERKILFSKEKIDLWIHNQEMKNLQQDKETEVKSIKE